MPDTTGTELQQLYDELIGKLERLPNVKLTSIREKLPNALGFLQSIPGQKYYREPPAGTAPYQPPDDAMRSARHELRVWLKRVDALLEREQEPTTEPPTNPPPTPSAQTPGRKPWFTTYLEKLLGIVSAYQQPRTVSVKGNTLDVTFDVRTDTLHPMVLSKWNTYTKRRGLTSTSNKRTGEFTATVLDTRELPSVGQVVVAVPPKGLRFAKDRHFKGEVKQVDPDGTVHIMSYSDDKVVPVFATNIIEYKTDSGWHNPSVILPNTEVVQSFIKRGLLAQYLPPTLARG